MHERGVPLSELCRRRDVNYTRINKCKAQLGGSGVSGDKILKSQEDENVKLKRLWQRYDAR